MVDYNCDWSQAAKADLLAADGYKSSDSMDEEILRQLVQDLWDFINNLHRVTLMPEDVGIHADLRERVIEALNLDE